MSNTKGIVYLYIWLYIYYKDIFTLIYVLIFDCSHYDFRSLILFAQIINLNLNI